MVQNVKQISENRFRETFGRYYEEFNVGDIYEHRPGRSITERPGVESPRRPGPVPPPDPRSPKAAVQEFYASREPTARALRHESSMD